MVGCGHCCCCLECRSAWIAHKNRTGLVSHSCYKDSPPRHTSVIVSRCSQRGWSSLPERCSLVGKCDTASARRIYLDLPPLALDTTGASLFVRLPGRHLQVPEPDIYATRRGVAEELVMGKLSSDTPRSCECLPYESEKEAEHCPHWPWSRLRVVIGKWLAYAWNSILEARMVSDYSDSIFANSPSW